MQSAKDCLMCGKNGRFPYQFEQLCWPCHRQSVATKKSMSRICVKCKIQKRPEEFNKLNSWKICKECKKQARKINTDQKIYPKCNECKVDIKNSISNYNGLCNLCHRNTEKIKDRECNRCDKMLHPDGFCNGKLWKTCKTCIKIKQIRCYEGWCNNACKLNPSKAGQCEYCYDLDIHLAN